MCFCPWFSVFVCFDTWLKFLTSCGFITLISQTQLSTFLKNSELRKAWIKTKRSCFSFFCLLLVCLVCVCLSGSCKCTIDSCTCTVDRRLSTFSSTGVQLKATRTRSSTEIHISHCVFAQLCYLCLSVWCEKPSILHASKQSAWLPNTGRSFGTVTVTVTTLIIITTTMIGICICALNNNQNQSKK